MNHRVVVTGVGIVSPLGIGIEAFWDAICAHRVATDTITRFDASGYSSRVAAEVRDFDPGAFIGAKRVRWTDRFSQFALAAARLGFDDARFPLNGRREDVGVYIGSALGGVAYADEQHDVFRERGLHGVRPLLAISVFGGAATSNVCMEFGLAGPNVANGNSCASGTTAIGEAFRAVARGDVRAALAGGVEAPLSPLTFGAFTIIRAMSQRNDDPKTASRPFDKGRDGFVMAEGAGMLVLERFEDAVARGAHVYGEISGFGLSSDAYHMSAPHPDGKSAALAIRAAVEEAALAPGEIEAISAHGSSTVLNDSIESLALRSVFAEALDRIPVTASKGQHGHALGASGAWEAALSLLFLERELVPKIVNLFEQDSACLLPCVREDLHLTPQTVLSNSSGFGGINAALVFRSVSR